MDQRIKKKMLGIILAALLLLLTAMNRGLWIWDNQFAVYVSQQQIEGKDLDRNQLAWWGSLYPRLSLKSAMRLVGEPEEEMREIPVKITWKCKDLF